MRKEQDYFLGSVVGRPARLSAEGGTIHRSVHSAQLRASIQRKLCHGADASNGKVGLAECPFSLDATGGLVDFLLMDVLFTFRLGEGNRYVDELYAQVGSRLTVRADRKAFWHPRAGIKVLNLHWPEHLFERAPVTDGDAERFLKTLEAWKRTAAVVLTRHNSRPHFGSQVLRRIYEIAETHAHGIVHFGEYSLDECRLNERGVLEQLHAVIPHPLYETQPKTRNAGEARVRLGIPGDRYVVCAFGNMRHRENAGLALSIFRCFSNPKKTLVANRWRDAHPPSRLRPEAYIRWIWWKTRKSLGYRYRLSNEFVSDEDVQDYMLAANVVLIVRSGSLNSGILPLAFTFGRVVVGPDSGNIGEWLRKSGNPVFAPQTVNGSDVLRRAAELERGGQGEKNFQFAQQYWNPKLVTDQLIEFMGRVRRDRFGYGFSQDD